MSAAAGEREERSCSPEEGVETQSIEILEQSMESLIVSSDSCEESLLALNEVSATQGLLDANAEDLEFPTNGVNAEESAPAAATGAHGDVPDQELMMEEGEQAKQDAGKKKKRRLSSRRTRTVKLSESDKVVCEISGVQVTQ